MEKGKVSDKPDVTGIDPMEDKVYTKRLKIGEDVDNVELVYVSITSDDDTFSDSSVSSMRVNTRNVFDTWVNFFATEADEILLNAIYNAIK